MSHINLTRHLRVNIKAALPWMIMIAIILLIDGLMKWQHLSINLTSSMPIGIYQRQATNSIHRGDIVALCLPKETALLGLKRGYLRKGSCPSGAIPVLKEVIAVPGDNVMVTKGDIIVNGKPYWAPIQIRDRMGRTMVTKVVLNQSQQARGYWLYGMNNPIYSWDSRYYGEVLRVYILGIYRRIIYN